MFTSIIVCVCGFVMAVLYQAFEAEVNAYLVKLSSKEIEKEMPKQISKEESYRLYLAHRREVLRQAELDMVNDMINNPEGWAMQIRIDNPNMEETAIAMLLK